MSIQSEKLELIEWIAKINDLSIIEKIRKIHEEYKESFEFSDDVTLLERRSIERGLEDIKEGRLHSHGEVKKLYEKYL